MRRVLVGHDDGGAGKSASVSAGVVGLTRLAGHASVEVISHCEHIPVDRNNSQTGCQGKSDTNRRDEFHKNHSKRQRYLLREGGGLARLVLGGVDRLHVGVGEGNADCLTVFHEHGL